MISKSPTVYETVYDLSRETLRGVLWAVVESGPGAGVEMGSVSWRACAALYSLVKKHPVNRRGLLARELNQPLRPSPGAGEWADPSGSDQAAPAAGPDTTDVPPRFSRYQDDSHAQSPTGPAPAA